LQVIDTLNNKKRIRKIIIGINDRMGKDKDKDKNNGKNAPNTSESALFEYQQHHHHHHHNHNQQQHSCDYSSFEHDLERGDHVIRWTNILVYPIQVHGIVLSAGDEIVTIIDFGLTAPKTQDKIIHDHEEEDDGEQQHHQQQHQQQQQQQSSQSVSNNNENENHAEILNGNETENDHDHDHDNDNDNDNDRSMSMSLEEMVAPAGHEDRVMMEACEKHRQKQVGAQRINILTLTDEKEIKGWKKVNYGESLKKNWAWRWWKDKNKEDNDDDDDDDHRNNARNGEESGGDKGEDTDEDDNNQNQCSSQQKSEDDTRKWYQDEDNDYKDIHSCNENEIGKIIGKDRIKSPEKATSETKSESYADSSDGTLIKAAITSSSSSSSSSKVPTLPKSDPTNIVIARVRFLLTNPENLPAHHILISNSECIAVWCKTGRWSTLQASIFLQSTAAGNFKSSVLLATGVASATVTTTAPSAGIAGWLGFTTTSTVSLLSVQPWLIPLLAGYGLITVGTPLVLFHKAKERWARATIELNDQFWGSVSSDVYVEAIKSWSYLE
jgi:hypothetical protein